METSVTATGLAHYGFKVARLYLRDVTAPAFKANIVPALKCAYHGYKIFQAARLCMGDITVLGEFLVKIIAEAAADGLCDYGMEAVLKQAAKNVTSLGENATELGENISDFKKFAKQLGEELNRNGSPKGLKMMIEAQNVFETFSACDADGNGAISRKEFTRFCAEYGISRWEARRLFKKADRDRNGEISFSEWLETFYD